MTFKNIIFILNLSFIFFSCLAQDKYPADISFCIADLKFDGQNIKICEFGQGTLSRFKGHDALYGKGSVWKLFWEYLERFNKPFWQITPDNYFFTQKNLNFDLKDLCNRGGHLISSLNYLDKDEEFVKIAQNPQPIDLSSILEYKAIVINNNKNFGAFFFNNYNLKYPSALFTDQAAAFFVNSKYETNELFKHPTLRKYRPKSIVCKSIFYEKLSKEIAKKLGSKKFVIKPLNASRGSGVIIVDRLHLSKELKKILEEKDTLNPNDPTYKYWIDSKDKNFMVEEFVSSKPISIEDKTYDATMRVIFVLSHDSGKISVDVLSAYWKLPLGALEDYENMTKKHKSTIDKKRQCSAAVDLKDFEIVKSEITKAMQKAYALMLEKRRAYLIGFTK
jgi:hypothetical protein